MGASSNLCWRCGKNCFTSLNLYSTTLGRSNAPSEVVVNNRLLEGSGDGNIASRHHKGVVGYLNSSLAVHHGKGLELIALGGGNGKCNCLASSSLGLVGNYCTVLNTLGNGDSVLLGLYFACNNESIGRWIVAEAIGASLRQSDVGSFLGKVLNGSRKFCDLIFFT